MRIRYGVVENTGNVVLSRSLCYAMLAGLAVALLFQASAIPGAAPWEASQFAMASAQGFHFSQLLASARISAGILREELHNTWLFLYVFLVVWMIVLVWSLFERNRLKLGVSRREVYWLGWMSTAITSVAVLYGVGTNGLMAVRYPIAVPVSDGVALAFVLSLPIFAWSRMQQRSVEAVTEEDELVAEPRAALSMLHLNDEQLFTRARARFQEPLMEPILQQPQEGFALPNLLTAAPNAKAMAAVDRLLESAVTATRQLEIVAEPITMSITERMPEVITPPVARRPEIVVEPVTASVSLEPSAPSASIAPVATASATVAPLTEDFRENLGLMNSAWGRIENAGKEIDHWFEEQRRQVIARLETHPGARGQSLTSTPENFLNEKLSAVDADWLVIRHSALEIARWFGDVPAAGA
jgi:hypothetical protein